MPDKALISTRLQDGEVQRQSARKASLADCGVGYNCTDYPIHLVVRKALGGGYRGTAQFGEQERQ